MSVNVWRGDAPAVAQVTTVTIGTYDVTTTYSVTINGKSVSTLGTGGTAATTATALQGLLAASTITEFQDATWTVSAAVITGTAATAGVPFTLSTSVTGGTGTISNSTTTTSSGPNDASTAANWTTGAIPAAGDDLWFINSASSVKWGLASISNPALTSINGDSTFTGEIGLPRYNAVGGYYEYRARFLTAGFATLNWGQNPGQGSGSGRVQLDSGATVWTANIISTGTPADHGRPALYMKGTSAGNVLNVQSGAVGVAIEPGDTSTVLTVQIGYLHSQATDVTLTLGSGVTLTTIQQYGGVININSNVTTLLDFGGTANVFGTATVGTLDVEDGGTVNYYSSGALTTGTVGENSTLDYSLDPRPKTVANLTVYGTLNDPNKVVTYTNPPFFPNGITSPGGATLDWGTNFHLQRS
jgi:hypothetical protein